MPNLERDAVVGWLKELRPETVFVEWPPAVRPIETEGGVSSQLTALGEALDQFDESDLHGKRCVGDIWRLMSKP